MSNVTTKGQTLIRWWMRLLHGRPDLSRVHILNGGKSMVCGRTIPRASRLHDFPAEGWGRGIDAGWETVTWPVPEEQMCKRCRKIAGEEGRGE